MASASLQNSSMYFANTSILCVLRTFLRAFFPSCSRKASLVISWLKDEAIVALGDALAAVLEMAGHDVTREFYINDAGNQIENFGLSLEARYLQLLGREGEIPEGGYHGEDIKEHMQELIEQEGDRFLDMDSPSRRAYFIEYALEKNIRRMKTDLENFGVHFDVWFSEQSLHDSGRVDEVIKLLTDKDIPTKRTVPCGLKLRSLEP